MCVGGGGGCVRVARLSRNSVCVLASCPSPSPATGGGGGFGWVLGTCPLFFEVGVFGSCWVMSIPPAPSTIKWYHCAHFERVLSHFGLSKVQKALKMRHFGAENGSKMGQKRAFPKVILGHMGWSKRIIAPILSPSEAV